MRSEIASGWPKDRRIALLTLAALALAVSPGRGDGPAEPKSPPRKPNVLLISIDALRADHLSFLGYPRPTSPNLDTLAKRAVVFEEAFSGSSWTPPSVASLLTGLHPIHHGMIGGAVRIADDASSVAEVLARAGYRTRAVVQNAWFAPEFGFNRGFDEYRWFDFRGDPLCDAATEADVVHWMTADADKPFFLWLHHLSPHCPYVPREPFATQWSPEHYSRWCESVGFDEMQSFKDRMLLPNDLARFVALYDSEVRFTDEHIGDVLCALADTGLDRETIVVVVADHGEEFKDHGALGHYRTLHREVTRVPMLIALPGADRSVRFPRPVSSVDIVPTLCAVLGIDPPTGLDGEGLLRRCADPERAEVRSASGDFTVARASPHVFSFRYARTYDAGASVDRLRHVESAGPDGCGESTPGQFANVFAVRDARWTLLCDTDQRDLEASKAVATTQGDADPIQFLAVGVHYHYHLFDRSADPNELVDVVGHFPDVAFRLARVLRDAFRGRPLRVPLPAETHVSVSPEVSDALRGLGYVK